MNIYELILGQIPEAIYFALFIIFTKQLKTKRVLFTTVMTIEYLLLLRTLLYNTWSHILFFAITYIVLKILYKEKCQITDIFTLTIASIILILFSCIPSLVFSYNMLLAIIASRIVMILFFVLFRKKLCNIQKLYKRLWNRNDKIKKRMKSTTFRAINTIVFNLMFYIINFGMFYALFFKEMG